MQLMTFQGQATLKKIIALDIALSVMLSSTIDAA